MEREIAQKQPVNARNIVENARLSASFRELFRPGLNTREAEPINGAYMQALECSSGIQHHSGAQGRF